MKEYKTVVQKVKTKLNRQEFNTEEADSLLNEVASEGWLLEKTNEILLSGSTDLILFTFSREITTLKVKPI